MVENILENGILLYKFILYFFFKLIKFIVIGVLIKCMVKDALPGQMAENMKEIMSKIKNMDMEIFNGINHSFFKK